MCTPPLCLTKTYPHVALLAPTINQPFPPSTSPISPPVPTLDQPHENPPTPAMSVPPVPNTDQPHLSTSTQHQPAPSPSPLVPTFDQPHKYPASTYLQPPSTQLWPACTHLAALLVIFPWPEQSRVPGR
ncbi:hypothetical protein EDD16DRAFT_1527141 [Pisolithus croceorrhizus]|nr:hypothetical protein EDD16DRAFT_1527141 [Pisolithus croceorrhizus]